MVKSRRHHRLLHHREPLHPKHLALVSALSQRVCKAQGSESLVYTYTLLSVCQTCNLSSLPSSSTRPEAELPENILGYLASNHFSSAATVRPPALNLFFFLYLYWHCAHCHSRARRRVRSGSASAPAPKPIWTPSAPLAGIMEGYVAVAAAPVLPTEPVSKAVETPAFLLSERKGWLYAKSPAWKPCIIRTDERGNVSISFPTVRGC